MNHLVDINKVLAAFDAEIDFRRSMYSLLEEKRDAVLIDDHDGDGKDRYNTEMAFNERGGKYLSNFRDYIYDLFQKGELS